MGHCIFTITSQTIPFLYSSDESLIKTNKCINLGVIFKQEESRKQIGSGMLTCYIRVILIAVRKSDYNRQTLSGLKNA